MSRLIVIVLLALSSLTLPSAAQAERWTADDPTADVVDYDMSADDPCDPATQSADPDNGAADLTRVGVTHRQRSIVLRATTSSTGPVDHRSLAFYLDTPGRAYVVAFDRMVLDRRSRTFTYLEHFPRRYATASCEEIFEVDPASAAAARPGTRCRRPAFEVDGTTVELRVLRRCVGDPAWVRIGAYGTASTEGDESTLPLDTLTPEGEEPTSFVFGTVSPKVRVG